MAGTTRLGVEEYLRRMDDGVCSGGWNNGHTRGGDPGSGCGWEGHRDCERRGTVSRYRQYVFAPGRAIGRRPAGGEDRHMSVAWVAVRCDDRQDRAEPVGGRGLLRGGGAGRGSVRRCELSVM